MPLRTLESLDDHKIDGLIVGGGTDVFPGLFQNDPKQDYLYDQPRDEMEMAWLKRAEADDIPVLGICRGAQMMNVMNRGSLHMDISIAYENAHYPKSLFRKLFYRKDILVEPRSLFFKIVRLNPVKVNSYHSQSIDRLGRNLKVSAQERNGIVQVIERPDHPYYLGVQFHPEYMIYRADMRNIFKTLIEHARKKAASTA